jgi:hypothetical protein
MERTFTPEALMTHVRYLADTIGPRPAASGQERLAADYVRRILADEGIDTLYEQGFTTHDSAGWRTIPYLAAALLLIPIGWFASRAAKLFAGLGLIGTAAGLRESLLSKPAPFDDLIARAESQNIVATLKPRGEVTRRLVLTAHLDTQKVRGNFPREPRSLTKPFNTVGMGLLGLIGGSLIWDALSGKKDIRWWQLGGLIMTAFSLAESIRDETNPYVDGANDNASAVAVALEIARRLHAAPLEQTEVVVLFTGSEEVGCTGMEHFLRAHPFDPANTFFLTLEMLGAGRVGYLQRHGISHVSEYVPGPRMTVVARQVGERMGLRGHQTPTVEEQAVISRYGYDGVVLAGLDSEGYLPNWHRLSDHAGNINADTLTQAAAYAWGIITELDSREHIP